MTSESSQQASFLHTVQQVSCFCLSCTLSLSSPTQPCFKHGLFTFEVKGQVFCQFCEVSIFVGATAVNWVPAVPVSLTFNPCRLSLHPSLMSLSHFTSRELFFSPSVRLYQVCLHCWGEIINDMLFDENSFICKFQTTNMIPQTKICCRLFQR